MSPGGDAGLSGAHSGRSSVRSSDGEVSGKSPEAQAPGMALRFEFVRLSSLNPLRHIGPPAMLGVLVAVLAIVGGGPWAWTTGLVPGVIFLVLGVRIAYDSRLSADADRIRGSQPWNAGTPLWAYRQINGAVIAVFGIFFLCFAAAGIYGLAT